MKVYTERRPNSSTSVRSSIKTSPTRSFVSDGETLGRSTPDVSFMKSKFYDGASRLEHVSDSDSVRRQKRINNKLSEMQRMILRIRMQCDPTLYSFRRNSPKAAVSPNHVIGGGPVSAKKKPTQTSKEIKSSESKPYVLDLIPKVKPLMKPPPIQENPYRQRFNKQIERAFLNDVFRKSFQ